MILNEAYQNAVSILSKSNIDESEFKALCLVCSVIDIKNSQFLLNKSTQLTDAQHSVFTTKLQQLAAGQPLQYVLGKWDFYDNQFFVGEGVLIPRPETEELVDLALSKLKGVQNPTVIDLCSGTGCIGISIAKKIPTATVICVEKSQEAFKYLKMNSQNTPNVQAICADITTRIELPIADIIISNPPYIKTSQLPLLQSEVLKEPVMALDGGDDGLYFYRVINDLYAKNIKTNGCLLLEIGNDQGSTIASVLSNFSSVDVIKDMYANYRMVVAKR